MKKGFTLVELLGVIILLGLLLLIAYPKTIELSKKKQAEIDDAKMRLINNAAFSYLEQRRNEYPRNIGNVYCILLQTLDEENLIPIDIDKILEDYKYVKVKIGKNKTNNYSLQNDCQEIKN